MKGKCGWRHFRCEVSRNMRKLLMLLTAAGLCGAADLPVREVILFKHGVGYFARSGELKAGETARIDFKAEEMNDVLKSLTITDGKGGKVSGVRYDASETLESAWKISRSRWAARCRWRRSSTR